MFYYELTILCIILLFISIYFISGFILFKKIMMRNKSNRKLPYLQVPNFFDEYEAQNIYTGSSEKGTLHAYIKINDSAKWVILCHSHRSNAYNMSLFARKYYEQGYSVLAIDSRAHGESGSKINGLGYFEKRDIISWCNYLIKNYGNSITITLFGISMGATTLMLASSESDLPTNVTCIVEDSGYGNFYELFKYSLTKKHPIFGLMALSSLRFFANNIAYYDIKNDVKVEESLKRCKVPMLFIYGDNDTILPPSMIEKLFTSCNASKKFILIDNAKHNEACLSNDLYWNTIFDFIKTYE